MLAIKFKLFLFLNILYVTDGARRIVNGSTVDADKTYVVYLVKAPNSNKIYDEWLCGGALVSTWFIITSAACVADVEYMYAIAGYKKYVPDAEIDTDKCTKEKKKKVVYTCVPVKHKISYHEVEKWSFIDIALVKVESAYDLNDSTFKTLCSYIPTVISINYEQSFQKPGTDALVYGWGHLELWRKPEDNSNYNQPTMRYVAAKILDKATCKKSYETLANMSGLIDQFMICTLHKGEFNDKGDFLMNNPSPKLMGCNNKQLLNNPVHLNSTIELSPNTSVNNDDLVCDDDDDIYQDMLIDATRREDENTNETSNDLLQHKNNIFNRTTSRKYGICQNDHGGPLVTWVGGNEILIGVASVFRVTQDFKCMGPYLYTSTQCNGAFLDCILSNSDFPDIQGRRAKCDSPPAQRGFDTVERYISWENHPSGAADNEKNATTKLEKQRRDLKSPQALQRLFRFDILVKTAKDRTAILRQERDHV